MQWLNKVPLIVVALMSEPYWPLPKATLIYDSALIDLFVIGKKWKVLLSFLKVFHPLACLVIDA